MVVRLKTDDLPDAAALADAAPKRSNSEEVADPPKRASAEEGRL
jgi:hypothetical protein